MKKILIITLMASALALTGIARAQAPGGRVVSVDMNRLFKEYYRTPISEAKLKEVNDAYKQELDGMLTKFRAQTDDLNKLREEAEKTEYSAEVREQKKKAVRETMEQMTKDQRQLEEYTRARQTEFQRQKERMTINLIKEISDAVSKEASDAGYDYVFDKSGNTLNGVPAVLYVKPALDITDGIIKILNKSAPKTEEKTPAPKAEEKK